MKIELDVDYENIEAIVRQALMDDLEVTSNPILLQSLMHVIAWYSTPGSFMDGMYDLEEPSAQETMGGDTVLTHQYTISVDGDGLGGEYAVTAPTFSIEEEEDVS